MGVAVYAVMAHSGMSRALAALIRGPRCVALWVCAVAAFVAPAETGEGLSPWLDEPSRLLLTVRTELALGLTAFAILLVVRGIRERTWITTLLVCASILLVSAAVTITIRDGSGIPVGAARVAAATAVIATVAEFRRLSHLLLGGDNAAAFWVAAVPAFLLVAITMWAPGVRDGMVAATTSPVACGTADASRWDQARSQAASGCFVVAERECRDRTLHAIDGPAVFDLRVVGAPGGGCEVEVLDSSGVNSLCRDIAATSVATLRPTGCRAAPK